ncbi:MAG: DUF342 domain-containing protein [Thiohalomonadales bacterium]
MNLAASQLPTEANIELHDDGKSVFLTSNKVAYRTPISVAWLMDQLHNSRYAHAKIDPIALRQWIKTYNSGHEGDGGYNCGEEISAAVAELIDAQCEIKVDADSMSAYLYITPAMGGHDISRRNIVEAIIKSHISRGIINRSITEALQQTDASKLLIAKGRPPQHGSDSSFEIVNTGLQKACESKNSSIKTEDSRHKVLVQAQTGEVLMKRTPPTAGIDGEDIYGCAVTAYQGQSGQYPQNLSGVTPSPEDPNLLCASISGQATPVENGFNVLPIITLDQVDLSTGNIDFDGTVHVRGNVCSGMSIISSGDVFIDGRVEHAAHIRADGDISINIGIFGQIDEQDQTPQRKNQQTELQGGGNIFITTASHVRIQCEQSLIVNDQMTRCEVDVKHHVQVGAGDFDTRSSLTGCIDGGTIKAGYSICANILGSTDACLTRLQVGELQSITQQGKRLQIQIDSIHSERNELERTLAQWFAKQVIDGATKMRKAMKVDALMGELLKLNHELMQYQIDLHHCVTEMELLKQARIVGHLKINPNLRLKIANHSQTNRGLHPAGRFELHRNNITFRAD